MEGDRAYFYDRAEAELKLAQRATDPAVVKAHYQLAGFYLDRVYGAGDDRPSNQKTGPSAVAFDKSADALVAQLKKAGVIIVGPPATNDL